MATMKLIAGSLIVVVALLVGVGSMAALIPRTWSLIKHPVPSEELTHEELLTELEKITYDVRNRWKKGSGPPEFAERVASLLYKTEDKNSVQIVNGVSVAKLIEQNSFNGLEECSEEALKKRARAMAETNGTTLGIDIYVFECIHNAIKYCLEHKEKVVEEEINNRQWLDVLGDKLWDDLYQEENKQKAKRSALIDYIQWVPEDSLAEKDVGIEEQVDYDGTLMEHPEPSEELSREELMAQLGRLRPSNKEPRVEFFVDKLYKSKAKATTEVINGVTVEQLIDANQFNGLNDCSRESLRQRSEIFFRTQPNKNLGPGWVSDGDQVANAYVLECLFRLARYCYDNREEVVSMGINDEDWLGELGRRSVDSSIRNKFNYYFGGNAPELIYFMKFQPSDDALIPHPPEPSEELTKLELFALLDDEWFGFNIPEFTVEYLYKTQQKESSLVMNGVSVANLIELNSFTGGLNECSKVALKERARVVEEVERRLEPEVNKMMFKLNVYALHCLHKAAKYCFEHKNEVVERGINEEQWLKRLRKNIWKEKNIVNNIYEGYPDSTLARYITNA